MLKGFDQLVNLVLDESKELLRGASRTKGANGAEVPCRSVFFRCASYGWMIPKLMHALVPVLSLSSEQTLSTLTD